MFRRAQPLPHGRGSVKCACRARPRGHPVSKRLGLNARDISPRLLSEQHWPLPTHMTVALGDVGVGLLEAAFGLRCWRLPGLPASDIFLEEKARRAEVTVGYEHTAVNPVEIGNRFHGGQGGVGSSQQ